MVRRCRLLLLLRLWLRHRLLIQPSLRLLATSLFRYRKDDIRTDGRPVRRVVGFILPVAEFIELSEWAPLNPLGFHVCEPGMS